MSYIDMTGVDTLEIVIDASGTKVWINDGRGQCVARWYRIERLIVNDERSDDEYGGPPEEAA